MVGFEVYTTLWCLCDVSKLVYCFTLVQRTRERMSWPETCSLCESPIAQWLMRPTCISKVVGSIPAGGSDFFSEHYIIIFEVVT